MAYDNTNRGTIAKNARKTEDKHPDIAGSINVLTFTNVAESIIRSGAQINQDPDISQQITLWSQGGSEVIRGTVESEREPAILRRNTAREQSVPRGSPDALADPVGHPHDQDLRPACNECEQRPCDRCERIAEKHGQLAMAEFVAEITRKQFENAGDRFRKTLYQPDRKWRCAE